MIQSAGIGSGLDIASLVQQLVDAERAPAESRLARQEARAQAQLSALGLFRGALTSLQSAAEGLDDDGAFESFSASSANEERFSAAASSGAASGRYDIEVVALAQAHRLASGAFADADTTVGYGTLTVSLGGANFNIDIDAADASLADIRDAINAVGEGAGFAATLVTADDGTRLVLRADDTGAASALTVTASGGDGGLDQLVYDPGVLENLSELDPAQDAQIRVDGFLASSDSNVFSGVIEGVTVTTVEAEPGQTYELTVDRDSGVAGNAIQSFVAAFNNFSSTVRNLTRVDGEGRGSIMTGDSLVRNAGNGLRSVVGGALGGGTLRSLSEIGISFDENGTLAVDDAVLNAALEDDPVAVAALFNGDDGLVARLDSRIDALIDSDGMIQGREDGLEVSLERIADQREALDRRIARVESRYLDQFAALDSLIAQLRTTSDFLSSQLATLPGVRSSSGN